jgi:nicotinamidase-related amidase
MSGPNFPVDPARMALLNVDMQNLFVEDSPVAAPSGRGVLKQVNTLIDVCRKSRVQIIHTSHVLRDDHSNVGIMGEIVPPISLEMIKKSAPSSFLHAELNVADEDILLDKPRFGSFQSTDLGMVLRSRGIDTVMISGIATNLCCETTAREANARDFRVFFLSDATATFPIGDVSAEEIQKVTCATLGFAFAQVLTTTEMIAKLESASRNNQ